MRLLTSFYSKILFCIFSILLICFFRSSYSQTQTPLYLTFVTHNEDAEPYNTNFNYYILRRNIIVQMANMVVSKGAKWDFQSDWRFLLGVRNFDTGSVITNTNGKNIIKWLAEDKGIQCDPHAHENAYNYADIAYLHEQLGIIPAKVVGGFLYDTIVNGNNWENLETGIYGRVYTSYFWKPDILWGGGTQNHFNDPQNIGAWKPQSMANYFFHDSTKHLTLIGNGCNNKIYDTSVVTTSIKRIRNVVNAITYNILPDTGFYTSTVFMSNGQFNSSQLLKMTQFIDSMSSLVAQGKVQWKTINEIYQIWNTSYGKKPFRTDCSQIPTTYGYYDISVIPEGFYNSANNSMNMKDNFTVYLRNIVSPYSKVDSANAVIDSLTFTGYFAFKNAVNGTYYISTKHRNSIETWSKAGGETFTRGSVMNYYFTSSQSNAYGNNLVLKGSKYCIYGGDVTQNGAVDASDLAMIDYDVFNFQSGYLITDLTGNNFTDAEDIAIADNNVFNFVVKISP